MTEGTTQSAEKQAIEIIADWARNDMGLSGTGVGPALCWILMENNLTIIDTDELAQLRADVEAVADFAEGYDRWFRDRSARVDLQSLFAGVEPILARRRAQEGE